MCICGTVHELVTAGLVHGYQNLDRLSFHNYLWYFSCLKVVLQYLIFHGEHGARATVLKLFNSIVLYPVCMYWCSIVIWYGIWHVFDEFRFTCTVLEVNRRLRMKELIIFVFNIMTVDYIYLYCIFTCIVIYPSLPLNEIIPWDLLIYMFLSMLH